MNICCSVTTFALSVLWVNGSIAQTIPQQTLGAPELLYARDFSDLRSLRPLSNGSVIAVDGIGAEVVLLSSDGATAVLVGRRGQGPNEYMDPLHTVPIGDSDFSLLVDMALQRLLVVDPNGNVIVSEPWRLPFEAIPSGRDVAEGMYYDLAGSVRLDDTGRVIEAPGPILRTKPGQEVPDTLAWVTVHELAERWAASPVSRMFSPGPNGVARFNLSRSPFGAQDLWALMPDGRIAIARVRPYRVDVVSTNGVTTEGPPVPFQPVAVTAQDREAFLAGMTRGLQGGTMSFSTDDGQRIPLERPGPGNVEFPTEKPAFPHGGLHVTASEILVQRHVPHSADHSLIDVFDGNGRLATRIRLPAERVLVAATEQALYAIVYDELDVQTLERYAR